MIKVDHIWESKNNSSSVESHQNCIWVTISENLLISILVYNLLVAYLLFKWLVISSIIIWLKFDWRWQPLSLSICSEWWIRKEPPKFDRVCMVESWKYCQHCEIVEPNKMLPNYGNQKISFLTDCLCQKGRYFVPTFIITFNFFVCIIFYFIRPLQEQQLLCLKTA